MINQTNWPLLFLETLDLFTISFIGVVFPELCNYGWKKATKTKPNGSKIQDIKIVLDRLQTEVLKLKSTQENESSLKLFYSCF